MRPMYVIVVLDLAGEIRDTVGPFWEHSSAVAFAHRNVERMNYRWSVRPMKERGAWLAEAEEAWKAGK